MVNNAARIGAGVHFNTAVPWDSQVHMTTILVGGRHVVAHLYGLDTMCCDKNFDKQYAAFKILGRNLTDGVA